MEDEPTYLSTHYLAYLFCPAAAAHSFKVIFHFQSGI